MEFWVCHGTQPSPWLSQFASECDWCAHFLMLLFFCKSAPNGGFCHAATLHSRCSVRETFTNNNKSWCKVISCKQHLACPPQLGQNLLWQFLVPRSTKKKRLRFHLPVSAYLLFFLPFFSFCSSLSVWMFGFYAERSLCSYIWLPFFVDSCYAKLASPKQGLDISQWDTRLNLHCFAEFKIKHNSGSHTKVWFFLSHRHFYPFN